MRKAARILALGLVGAISLAWLSALSLRGPLAVRTSWEAAKLKLSGRAGHLSWRQVFAYVLPVGLHPSEIVPLDHLEACRRVPVRLERMGSGPCDALWETPLGAFWAGRQEGHVLASLIDVVLVEGIYHRPPVAVRPGDVAWMAERTWACSRASRCARARGRLSRSNRIRGT